MKEYDALFRFTGTPVCPPGLAHDVEDCLVVKGWLIPRNEQPHAAVLPFPVAPVATQEVGEQLWQQAS